MQLTERKEGNQPLGLTNVQIERSGRDWSLRYILIIGSRFGGEKIVNWTYMVDYTNWKKWTNLMNSKKTKICRSHAQSTKSVTTPSIPKLWTVINHAPACTCCALHTEPYVPSPICFGVEPMQKCQWLHTKSTHLTQRDIETRKEKNQKRVT